MAQHLRLCTKALTAWRRQFRKVKNLPARERIAHELLGFALKMHASAVKEMEPLMPKVMKPIPLIPQQTPPVDNAHVAPGCEQFTSDSAKTITSTVDFSGVVEGKNLPRPTGFPEETELKVFGFCPNLRLLAAELPDGRKVSVWKGPRNWRLPSTVKCKIDPASNPTAPTYSPA